MPEIDEFLIRIYYKSQYHHCRGLKGGFLLLLLLFSIVPSASRASFTEAMLWPRQHMTVYRATSSLPAISLTEMGWAAVTPCCTQE